MGHPLSQLCNATGFSLCQWGSSLHESSIPLVDPSHLAQDIFDSVYRQPQQPASVFSEESSAQGFWDWTSETWEGLGISFQERMESAWDSVRGAPQQRYRDVNPNEWSFEREEFYDWLKVAKEEIAGCWGDVSRWRSADDIKIIWSTKGYYTSEPSPFFRKYGEYYANERCEESRGCCFDSRNQDYPKLNDDHCKETMKATPRPRPAWYIVTDLDPDSDGCRPNDYGHPACSGHYAYIYGTRVIVHTLTEKEHDERVAVCKSLESKLEKKFYHSDYYGPKNINKILNAFYQWVEEKSGNSLEVRKREAWRLRMGGLMPAMHNLLGKPGDETLAAPLESISTEGSEHLGPEYGETVALRKWVYALTEWWTQFHANLEAAQKQLDAKHLPGWKDFQKWEIALGVKDKGMSIQCTYPRKRSTCYGSFDTTRCSQEVDRPWSRVEAEDLFKMAMGPRAQENDTFSYRETALPCVPQKPQDAAPTVEDLVKWRLEDYEGWIVFQNQIKEYAQEVGEEKVREFNQFLLCNAPLRLYNGDRFSYKNYFPAWKWKYLEEEKDRLMMDELYTQALEAGDLSEAERWVYIDPCRQHYKRPEPSVGSGTSSTAHEPGSGDPEPTPEPGSSLAVEGVAGALISTATAAGILIRRRMSLVADVAHAQISQVASSVTPSSSPSSNAPVFFSISTILDFSMITETAKHYLAYIQALFEWMGLGSKKEKPTSTSAL